MKNFLKIFVAILISLYALASFSVWDITTITQWHPMGRFMFVLFSFFLSVVIDVHQNEK